MTLDEVLIRYPMITSRPPPPKIFQKSHRKVAKVVDSTENPISDDVDEASKKNEQVDEWSQIFSSLTLHCSASSNNDLLSYDVTSYHIIT